MEIEMKELSGEQTEVPADQNMESSENMQLKREQPPSTEQSEPLSRSEQEPAGNVEMELAELSDVASARAAAENIEEASRNMGLELQQLSGEASERVPDGNDEIELQELSDEPTEEAGESERLSAGKVESVQPAEQDNSQDSDIPMWRKSRFIVIIMLFLGMANAYVMRTNMSVAIVAMVNHTAIGDKDNSTRHSKGEGEGEGEFEWSYKKQGYILASFFWGYVFTQVPIGCLIHRYGAKHFLGWGMLVNSLAAFAVPIAARKGGPWGLCAVRFIQGLGEGPIVPCTHSLLAVWIPPNERSRAGAIVYSGAQFGTIVSMPLSGLLAEYGFDGGWPTIFYVFGISSTLWCLLYFLLVPENPQQTKRINETERKHIVDSIWEAQPADTGKTPFGSFLTSRAFWAILVAHAGQNYGYETLMTMLPTYMKGVLDVNIKANGFLSALPYVAMFLLAIAFAFVADLLIRRGVSVTATRKIMNSIGQYGPAVAILAVGYVNWSLAISIIVFVLGMGLNGGIYSGFKVNHLDLSPRYAGLLISITNCVANVVGVFAPMLAGYIIDRGQTIENWRIVFFIAGGVYIFSATIYALCASGKPKW